MNPDRIRATEPTDGEPVVGPAERLASTAPNIGKIAALGHGALLDVGVPAVDTDPATDVMHPDRVAVRALLGARASRRARHAPGA